MKKLRKKNTGEIGELCITNDVYEVAVRKCMTSFTYDTLAELNEEWEDYKEPDVFYFIDRDGQIIGAEREALLRGLNSKAYDYEMAKSIGNVFDTLEEAEKAVEKLKAWKRLKDNGFKFVACYDDDEYIKYKPSKDYSGMYDDLDLLFGGEE